MKPLLNIDDVAQKLGKATKTIRRWMAAGKFPQPLPGRHKYLWTAECVDEWIASNLRTAGDK